MRSICTDEVESNSGLIIDKKEADGKAVVLDLFKWDFSNVSSRMFGGRGEG